MLPLAPRQNPTPRATDLAVAGGGDGDNSGDGGNAGDGGNCGGGEGDCGGGGACEQYPGQRVALQSVSSVDEA